MPKHIVRWEDFKNAVWYKIPSSSIAVLKLSNNVIVIATPKILPKFLDSDKIPLAIPNSSLLTQVIIALFDGD